MPRLQFCFTVTERSLEYVKEVQISCGQTKVRIVVEHNLNVMLSTLNILFFDNQQHSI